MFGQLKKFDVKEATAWFEIPELGPKARIHCKLATENNKPYYNAMLRKSSKGLRRMAGGRITEQDLAKNRDEDRILFPKFVIIGWEDVPDGETGELVPYSRENAVVLCTDAPVGLPDHIFNTFRNWAASPENFYPEDVDEPMDSPDLKDEVAAQTENSDSVSGGN